MGVDWACCGGRDLTVVEAELWIRAMVSPRVGSEVGFPSGFAAVGTGSFETSEWRNLGSGFERLDRRIEIVKVTGVARLVLGETLCSSVRVTQTGR